MEKEKFGQALLLLRKQQNMSQKELAEKLCVTPAAVSKWEHGQNYPDITMISTIADIFNISCDDLLHPDKVLSPSKEKRNLSGFAKKNKVLIPICLCLVLLLAVGAIAMLKKPQSTITHSPFTLISARSAQIAMTNEKVYELAVLVEGTPSQTEYNAYYNELRQNYEAGAYGNVDFSTLKIYFYEDENAASTFEEGNAAFVASLYF